MAAADLASRNCIPCRGGVPPLSGPALETLHAQLADWNLAGEHHIERSFRFPNFKSALAFVDRIGAVAEEQGHHPDICFGWGNVTVTLFTHKIKGLTESDFILAAKVDRLYLPAGG